MKRFWKILRIVGLLALFAIFVLPYLIPLPKQPDYDSAQLTPPGGALITVEGVRTAVMDVGPRDGPAVVLVHGFGGSTFSWRYTLPALAEAGFRAVAMDLKGFGLADKNFDADYSHAAQADFVAAVMTDLGVERATLVGHSMGSNVIAHFALRYPERVERLVFVDGAVFTEARRVGWQQSLLSAAVQVPPFRRWGQIILRSALTPEQVGARLRTAYSDPAFVTPTIERGYLLPQTVKDWELALLGIVRDSGKNALPALVSSITAPVLIVWGEDDAWVPLAAGEALRDSLPGAQWTTFAGAGHLPMEEQALAFNLRLYEFLGFKP